MRHALATDPSGFQVAVSKGKIQCIAITILRGKTHFLAMFFALPEAQSHGVGRKVLSRAFAAPNPPRDAVRCLVASLDFRAHSLYLKFGMQPRTIVYHFSGKKPSKRLSPNLQLLQVGPTGQSTKQSRDIAARFDRVLREVRRDADQRFFLTSVRGSRFFEARKEGRTVGYVVIRGNGIIGPAGVADSSLGEAILTAAIEKARDIGIKNISVWIPGLNQGAVQAAFSAGLKVDFFTVWMSARQLGHLEKYIPSGGVLF